MKLLAILYVVLSGVGALLFLFLFYRLLRLLVRRSSAIKTTFGEDLKTRLISLGIASLFYPSALPSFISASVNFLLNFFSGLPNALMGNWEMVKNFCERSEQSANCIAQSGFLFLGAWAAAFSKAATNAGLTDLSYYHLIMLLALWALIARLLGPVSPQQAGEVSPVGKSGLYHFFTGLKLVTRQNLLFFLILAIAGYLSVAAIAAIPGLRETATDAEEVSVERLKQQLSEVQSQAELRFQKETSTANPFSRLDDFLQGVTKSREQAAQSATQSPAPQTETGKAPAPSPTSKNAETTPSKAPAGALTSGTESGPPVSGQKEAPAEPDQIVSVRQQLEQAKQSRQELFNAQSRLLKQAQNQLKDAASIVTTTYEVNNVGRIGSREKSQYFLALSAYFRGRVSQLDSRINACSAALDSMDQLWRFWSENQTTALAEPDGRYSFNYGILLETTRERIFRDCNSSWTFNQPPERPALGGYLGPFGMVASWLLRTESLPLALITGLLGFGLLGSACSTVVRERARKRSSDPLVSDLSSVIIRGLSAAIVVFLAVEGGLAIFASGGSEPNPYVLLLTCLVAAVFSQDVWQYAHRRLLENFSGTNPAAPKPILSAAEVENPDREPENKPPPEELNSSNPDANFKE